MDDFREAGQLPLFAANEVARPEFADSELVLSFESELEAINYSIDRICQLRKGLTHQALAEEIGISKMVMTKLRQGEVGMPRHKLVSFVDKTKSFALLQFWCSQLGLRLMRRMDYMDEIAGLKQKIDERDREIEKLNKQLVQLKRAAGI